ncbi:hypothetical protein AB0C52_24060 [Streptomyces sp. NPDC048717]|uniref:hypothetical protein n=1 Tax=Streptomyces sp. NPDC048717 TaxID=3154928 RepID=UPI003432BF14
MGSRIWVPGLCSGCKDDSQPGMRLSQVHHDAGAAPLYVCEPCIRGLEEPRPAHNAAAI